MTQWIDEWFAEVEQKKVQNQFRLPALQADQCMMPESKTPIGF